VQLKIPRASVLTCMSSEMVGQLLLLIEVLRGLFKLRNVRTCEISCFLLPTCKTLLPSLRSFRSTIRPRYLHVILKMQKPDIGATCSTLISIVRQGSYRALKTQGQACRSVFTDTKAEHRV